MSIENWYLDCYFYGAMAGDKFPVNTFGPASIEDVESLQKSIGHKFNRTEVTQETKGLNPRSRDRWFN